MKYILSALVLCVASGLAVAQEPSTTINFNLVQVNHYKGEEKLADSIKTPGERVVIDLQDPLSREQFMSELKKGNVNVAPVAVKIEPVARVSAGSGVLPWESYAILYSPSGADSFRVMSSRTGCPGTEVRPSVAVAFATSKGWSNPPIRFGPLTDHTICPLGKGYTLEVSSKGDESPTVHLLGPADLLGKR